MTGRRQLIPGLHRHYKGMYYRVHGVVRHSETMEHLCLYETLYENERGRDWVRPLAMFLEDVQVDGVARRRFAPVHPAVLLIEGAEAIAADHTLGTLVHMVFPDMSGARMREVLGPTHGSLALVASLDGMPIGFKIGFTEKPGVFHSWLGGVHPAWRKTGVGDLLMTRQHEILRSRGIRRVETKTRADNRVMLILNLRHGFEIAGTYRDSSGDHKVLLTRSL